MNMVNQMQADKLLNDGGLEASNQYLTFLLNSEEYGIEILKVQEIKGWGPLTPLPNSPEHVLGVINLRGAIVPIIDLRIRLELATAEFTSTTAVIIVEVDFEGKMRTMGLVVDSVSDVYQLLPENIQEAAEVHSGVASDGFVQAFGRVEEKLLILLNLEPIVSSALANSQAA